MKVLWWGRKAECITEGHIWGSFLFLEDGMCSSTVSHRSSYDLKQPETSYWLLLLTRLLLGTADYSVVILLYLSRNINAGVNANKPLNRHIITQNVLNVLYKCVDPPLISLYVLPRSQTLCIFFTVVFSGGLFWTLFFLISSPCAWLFSEKCFF